MGMKFDGQDAGVANEHGTPPDLADEIRSLRWTLQKLSDDLPAQIAAQLELQMKPLIDGTNRPRPLPRRAPLRMPITKVCMASALASSHDKTCGDIQKEGHCTIISEHETRAEKDASHTESHKESE